MRIVRFVAAGLLAVALVTLSFRTTSTSTTLSPQVPCTASSLGQGFGRQLHLTSIQKYGCEGRWAYTWATVGTGLHAFGVTEVLNFDVNLDQWRIVSRLTDCKASILPHVVYRQGCFSN